MKLTLLCAIILAAFITPTLAARTIHPGVQGGYTLTNLKYDDPNPLGFWDAQGDNGFSAGVFFDIELNAPLSLVPEIRFTRYRNHVTVDSGPGTPSAHGEFEIEQDYVSVPVLMKWKPVPARVAELFFTGGVELGFLVSASARVNTVEQPGDIITDEEQDIKDTMENTNFSLLIGAGVDIHAASHIVVLQVRYNHGLTGVADDTQWITNWKTQAVEFLVGFGW